MDAIQSAYRLATQTRYFEEQFGDAIHRVQIGYDSASELFSVNINAFDYGTAYKNMGEVYDVIAEEVGG